MKRLNQIPQCERHKQDLQCCCSSLQLPLDVTHNTSSVITRKEKNLMMGLKRISRVLMNMVGWTMYRALMFFLYLTTHGGLFCTITKTLILFRPVMLVNSLPVKLPVGVS